ncbi:MAG: LysM peptidoglycan-binding domain-containing protein [Desulfovibrionaceae bacterium]|jgi:hypothetical protein|nr:LysM peptidoglycan-binding domain-containing protein [Desulfovibrionaceae bacterium]
MKHTFPSTPRALSAPLGLLAAAALLAALPVHAQKYGIHSPVSPAQRATAQQVAEKGVPLSALAPNAPDQYTVKRGDTLWGISSLFLKSPWRWPELWGMNLQDIRNPHLIYPGQQLYLERNGDRAILRMRGKGDGETGDTVHVSPRTRVDMLGTGPLPALPAHLIEPFLTEPLVVDDDTFERAPRVVAQANQSRVIMAKGDRIYARGPQDAPLLMGPGRPRDFRVFRTATPLKDPITGEILGYEGQYVGRAALMRGESKVEVEEPGAGSPGAAAAQPAAGDNNPAPGQDSEEARTLPVPATLDLVGSKEEIQVGDRLIPEPPRDFRSYVPHAPDMPVDARVVLVHGSAVRFAGQNHIVVINKGLRDGIENGHVLALLSAGPQIVDKTDGARSRIKLPDERNGLVMVFRPFDRVSYALVMQSANESQVGDKLTNPK